MDSSILESGQNHCSKYGSQLKDQTSMAHIVDPDETVNYEPSYQDLHCLQKVCFGL